MAVGLLRLESVLFMSIHLLDYNVVEFLAKYFTINGLMVLLR